MSTSSGRMPSGSATLAASQAVIASRDWDDAEHPRGGTGAGVLASGAGQRQFPVASTPRRFRATRPGTPRGRHGAEPSRSRSGEARRLDQPDRVDVEVELHGDRAANRREDLLGRTPLEPPLDLLYDREPLLALDLDREGGGAARSERGMAALGCPTRRPADRRSAPGG